ncbi:MAG: ATP-grasp domain-containing protein [Actinobacteria bacterium]|nr:ATP-grasp domain-containing protein [Actinomycetota bacterium]
MFGSVLVANRGEVACRVIRTLRRLGIRAVAVHSDADAGAKHVREADAAERIGEPPAPASYLNPAAIVEAGLRSGAEAVHPGYGFLAESPALALAVLDAGLAWVGPPPDVLALTGDKVAAREAFGTTGFPVLPGAGPFHTADEAVAAAADVGFPVVVKPVMGGGGIGMGVATDPGELRRAVETASARGGRFFADPAVMVERFVSPARHVEVQVLFDRDGRGIHLYERECSVQRRHQKVIEETPSPAVDPGMLERMTSAALRSMRAIGYAGAGTVECVVGRGGGFWFLEVNARLQVEHPVTEVVAGVDLVEEQLRIAAGDGISLGGTPPRHGHAIECRVYAEDPERFLPSPGRITRLDTPAGVRADFGYEAGDEVPMFYDPLIGKLVVGGEGREGAVAAMRAAVEGTRIDGVKTNLPALLRVLAGEPFASGRYDTGLLGQ